MSCKLSLLDVFCDRDVLSDYNDFKFYLERNISIDDFVEAYNHCKIGELSYKKVKTFLSYDNFYDFVRHLYGKENMLYINEAIPTYKGKMKDLYMVLKYMNHVVDFVNSAKELKNQFKSYMEI